MARNSGKRGYPDLLTNTHGLTYRGDIPNSAASFGTLIMPFSFNHAGYYVYSSGNSNSQKLVGLYAETRFFNESSARNLDIRGARFAPSNTVTKGYGISVRCVAK